MYTRYAEIQGLAQRGSCRPASPDLGGYKEVVLRFEGAGVYGQLKFESGGHRVAARARDRNPRPHSYKRLHSGRCCPSPTRAEEVQINPADLRIDTYRASGAGGQHINKTDSAVRITHIPTGIVAECQDDRSQHHQQAKALAVLGRIRDKGAWSAKPKEAAHRKSLVGSGRPL